MTAPVTDKDIDQLENDLKALKPAAAQLDTDITRVSTVRDQYKKELKEHLQTVHDMNEDPDNLEATVRKYYEVARIKTDNAREEIKAANEIIQPILKEIE